MGYRGRHVLGSNYFRYVRDPGGSYAEYSFDIDFVEAGSIWPTADHAVEDSLFVWGQLFLKGLSSTWKRATDSVLEGKPS
jgi:hypothetical protein